MSTNQMRLGTSFPVTDLRDRSGDVGGLRAWLSSRRDAVRRHQQRRRAIAELTRMSAWRLADLGIPRDRIPEVVDGLIAREGRAVRGLAS